MKKQSFLNAPVTSGSVQLPFQQQIVKSLRNPNSTKISQINFIARMNFLPHETKTRPDQTRREMHDTYSYISYTSHTLWRYNDILIIMS